MAKLNKKTFNNINNKYTKWVEDVSKTSPDLDVKYKIINQIADSYLDEVGETLPHLMLDVLTEWYLADDLKSKDVDKVAKTEYPILSPHQIQRRIKKHPMVEGDKLDYLNHTRGRRSKKVTKEKERN
ncbi:hypothetical protein [Romboutsia ilealis]|uniref:hypothetical protein n=1 Tax=Romboutsia ilealis TaxID=1115758 RepID=UPI0026F3F97C|nr:hypothetical protein [Romboutsia ilealis]